MPPKTNPAVQSLTFTWPSAGAAGRVPLVAASPAYCVRVLHPVPSQAVQGMMMRAHDFDHVDTLEVPAAPVQAVVEREVAFGEPPVPAARAAEIVFSAGYAEPGEVSEAFAPLVAAYHAADLRSLNVGDVLLVDAPDGTSTALRCDTVGWRRLEEAPTFGRPVTTRTLRRSPPVPTAPRCLTT